MSRTKHPLGEFPNVAQNAWRKGPSGRLGPDVQLNDGNDELMNLLQQPCALLFVGLCGLTTEVYQSQNSSWMRIRRTSTAPIKASTVLEIIGTNGVPNASERSPRRTIAGRKHDTTSWRRVPTAVGWRGISVGILPGCVWRPIYTAWGVL